MSKIKYLIVASSIVFFVACSEPKKSEPKKEEAQAEKKEEAMEVDADAVVKSADELRRKIENEIENIEPIQIETTGLRENIKQKWSKIHYYLKDNQVVRVKTYPHKEVSKRTEEFYYDNGKLSIVAIEDDGSGDRGKAKNQFDKIYYFKDGDYITEVNNSKEGEYTIKQSDAEKLLQEAKEYMDIFKSETENK